MNPYTEHVTCDICGGPGVGTPKTATAAWIVGNEIRHTDPETCAYYLSLERERLERERKEMEARE